MWVGSSRRREVLPPLPRFSPLGGSHSVSHLPHCARRTRPLVHLSSVRFGPGLVRLAVGADDRRHSDRRRAGLQFFYLGRSTGVRRGLSARGCKRRFAVGKPPSSSRNSSIIHHSAERTPCGSLRTSKSAERTPCKPTVIRKSR